MLQDPRVFSCVYCKLCLCLLSSKSFYLFNLILLKAKKGDCCKTQLRATKCDTDIQWPQVLSYLSWWGQLSIPCVHILHQAAPMVRDMSAWWRDILTKQYISVNYSQLAGGQNKNTSKKNHQNNHFITFLYLFSFKSYNLKTPKSQLFMKFPLNQTLILRRNSLARSFSTSRRQSTGSSHSSETLRSGKVRKGPSL